VRQDTSESPVSEFTEIRDVIASKLDMNKAPSRLFVESPSPEKAGVGGSIPSLATI
jgi:hypothetical protein